MDSALNLPIADLRKGRFERVTVVIRGGLYPTPNASSGPKSWKMPYLASGKGDTSTPLDSSIQDGVTENRAKHTSGDFAVVDFEPA